MSFKHYPVAWRVRLPGPRKLVLLYLADRAADDGGRVFPSVRTIADACGCSVRTVQSAMAEFIGSGLLRLVRECDPSKRRPREYRLDLDRLNAMAAEGCMTCTGAGDAPHASGTPVQELHPTGAGDAPEGCTTFTLGVLEVHPEPTNEPIKEPPKEPISESRPAKRARKPSAELEGDDPIAFESFWSEYPLKVAKVAAKKAFKRALEKVSLGELVLAARRYAEAERAKGTKPEHLKHPQGWLNDERWTDEVPPSSAGPDLNPFGVGRHVNPFAQSGGAEAYSADLFQFGQPRQRADKPSAIDIGIEAYQEHERGKS